ncbi:PECT1 [Symbiodinium sp. CCMP2592]|nr:PECT1 [Symbiodinium sp. CCMP2592]
MAALLKLAPRIFVELPDQPWLQHVYDHFGTARVFLQAATKLTGKQWNFVGPLVMSEWYGRRELWLLEEELGENQAKLNGCLLVVPCRLLFDENVVFYFDVCHLMPCKTSTSTL